MSAQIIELSRVRNYLAAREHFRPATDRAEVRQKIPVPPELMPYKGARDRLARELADDDPAYELFRKYKQAQAAYHSAVAEHARRTGFSVRQIAKFMQARREGRT